MNDAVLFLDGNKCVSCYNCVRACPVKAIIVEKNSAVPRIDEQRCIACGNCISVCSYSAISAVSNMETVEQLLKQEKEVAAICDPSIAGEFADIRDYRKFVSMIRRLGFSFVCEVSFGVDLVSRKQAELCQNLKGKTYIASHCPVVNMYVEKYVPQMVGNLAPIVPPAIAMASTVRKYYGRHVKIVNITPCLGMKKDNVRYGDSARIDAFLSFVELRKLFEKYDIREETLEYSDFDEPLGCKGSLYPIPEGFVEACGLSNSLIDGHFLSVEGKTDAINVLKQFSKHGNEFNSHLNIYFCKGCLMAPGTTKGQKFLRHNLVTDYSARRIKTLNKEKWKENMDRFSNKSDLVAFYRTDDKRLKPPSKQQIMDAFSLLGKDEKSKHTNCKSCGYDTCTELAIAIAQGIASADMCFSYAQKGSRIFNNQLKSAKEELVKLQSRFDKLKEEFGVQKNTNGELNRSLSLLIHHIYPGIAIINSEFKVVESNAGFIEILGDDAKEIDEVIPGLIGADIKTLLPNEMLNHLEYVIKYAEDVINKDFEYNDRFINVSIFSLVANKSVCMIFRNLYQEEERPEEIIHRVNDVIKENLLQVQQIGFILGEGAAKTEKMLNSIIKTYKEQIGQR